MKKYRVVGILSASVVIGVYEAENADAAIEMAEQDNKANWNPSLCHHCATQVDVCDIYETQAEEVYG